MWKIVFDERAKKDIKKLPKEAQKSIENFLKKKVIPSKDPTVFAKPLSGEYAGLWRFRIEKYRLIFEINNDTITIIVFRVGKRDKVYNQ